MQDTVENSLAAPQKQSYHMTQELQVQENWKYTFTQNLFMNAHRYIIHNSKRKKKKETTQMFIKWWKDKQMAVYLYNRISLSHEELWGIDTCYTVDELQKHDAKWKTTQKTTCMTPFIPKVSTESGNRLWVDGDWRQRGLRSNCSMATAILLGWQKCSKIRWWWLLHDIVHIQKSIKFYSKMDTFKWIK